MKWLLPFGLLALAATSTVVLADDADWWKSMTLYQVYLRSFQDSDGDGVGDIPGLTSRLDHFVDAGIDTIWVSPIYPSPMVDSGYDISDFRGIDPTYGTMEDYENMLAKAKSLGLRVLLDFVPNHTSDQHEWFPKSVAGIEPYKDYYVWHNGTVLENGTIVPPNNWVSVFGGSVWTWRDERQAYYLHHFTFHQPDLNFRNQDVIDEINEILVFWLDKGVDGFRIDALPFIIEHPDFPDEPLTGKTTDPTVYNYLDHIYSKNQIETYGMVTIWRGVIDNYTLNAGDNITRMITTESYANVTMVMKYFDYGAHLAMNFQLISNLKNTSSASDFKNWIDTWMDNMPSDGIANWSLGNHDRARMATRYESKRVDGLLMILLVLPGVGIIYYGDEIGMENTWISWEDTVDPKACNTNNVTYETQTRDPQRTAFQWDNTTSAGFSANATTWLPLNKNYVSLNLAAQKAADVSHYKVFQKLTALKKLPVIQKGSLNTQVLSDQVLAFSRDLTGYDSVYVLISFSNETTTVSLDVFESVPETLTIYTASVDSGLTIGDEVSSSCVELPALAAVVLASST